MHLQQVLRELGEEAQRIVAEAIEDSGLPEFIQLEDFDVTLSRGASVTGDSPLNLAVIEYMLPDEGQVSEDVLTAVIGSAYSGYGWQGAIMAVVPQAIVQSGLTSRAAAEPTAVHVHLQGVWNGCLITIRGLPDSGDHGAFEMTSVPCQPAVDLPPAVVQAIDAQIPLASCNPSPGNSGGYPEPDPDEPQPVRVTLGIAGELGYCNSNDNYAAEFYSRFNHEIVPAYRPSQIWPGLGWIGCVTSEAAYSHPSNFAHVHVTENHPWAFNGVTHNHFAYNTPEGDIGYHDVECQLNGSPCSYPSGLRGFYEHFHESFPELDDDGYLVMVHESDFPDALGFAQTGATLAAALPGTLNPYVVPHEIGHTLGLFHCQAEERPDGVTIMATPDRADPCPLFGNRLIEFGSQELFGLENAAAFIRAQG